MGWNLWIVPKQPTGQVPIYHTALTNKKETRDARTHPLLMINYKTCFQEQQGYNLEVKGTLPRGKDLKKDTHTYTHSYARHTNIPERARRSSLR